MKLEKSEVIWFNGELVPWDEARVHVLADVLHYGSSAFEGLRAYAGRQGTAVLGLKAHVRRLFRSCKILGMLPSHTEDEIAAAILETVRRNRHDACYIRPLVFRGYGVLGVDPTHCPVETIIATWPYGRHFGEEAREAGVDVCVSSWRRMAPDTFPAMAKAGANYLNSQLMVVEARRGGFADAIALDVDGYACEGTGMNVFLVLDGRLYTPPLFASILGGITREFVLRLARDSGLDVAEQRISREMLYIADELFFTGTAAEITPIRSVDRRPVADSRRGAITHLLQKEFFGILSGELRDRHGWLTPVAPH